MKNLDRKVRYWLYMIIGLIVSLGAIAIIFVFAMSVNSGNPVEITISRWISVPLFFIAVYFVIKTAMNFFEKAEKLKDNQQKTPKDLL